jgi:hypothetical protein
MEPASYTCLIVGPVTECCTSNICSRAASVSVTGRFTYAAQERHGAIRTREQSCRGGWHWRPPRRLSDHRRETQLETWRVTRFAVLPVQTYLDVKAENVLGEFERTAVRAFEERGITQFQLDVVTKDVAKSPGNVQLADTGFVRTWGFPWVLAWWSALWRP